MHGHCVPQAAKVQHLLGHLAAFLPTIYQMDGENRRQDLDGEWMLTSHTVLVRQQNRGAARHVKTRLFRNPPGIDAHQVRIHAPAPVAVGLELRALGGTRQMSSALNQRRQQTVGNGPVQDQSLL